MAVFGRRTSGKPVPPAADEPDPEPGHPRAAAHDLAELFEGRVIDGDGRIRVEDLLSAAAAVCGEACIAAAGEVDPDAHRFTPGAAVMSDRVNAILCANAEAWRGADESVFGLIRLGALAQGYEPEDFPPLDEPFKLFAASLGEASGEDGWGRVALSVPEANRPHVQPLRQAYELRAAARKVLGEHNIPAADWPQVCAIALVMELARVREAIDRAVAVRLVLETVNGMAKTAPMTLRHMREAQKG